MCFARGHGACEGKRAPLHARLQENDVEKIRSRLMQLGLSLALAAPLTLAAQTVADAPVVNRLLTAIATRDHAAFIASGTPEFSQISAEQFDSVAGQLSTRLQAGYKAEYFGNITQQGYRFSVWKINFNDGGDDLLATLNVSEGKVGGFLLR